MTGDRLNIRARDLRNAKCLDYSLHRAFRHESTSRCLRASIIICSRNVQTGSARTHNTRETYRSRRRAISALYSEHVRITIEAYVHVKRCSSSFSVTAFKTQVMCKPPEKKLEKKNGGKKTVAKNVYVCICYKLRGHGAAAVVYLFRLLSALYLIRARERVKQYCDVMNNRLQRVDATRVDVRDEGGRMVKDEYRIYTSIYKVYGVYLLCTRI